MVKGFKMRGICPFIAMIFFACMKFLLENDNSVEYMGYHT